MKPQHNVDPQDVYRLLAYVTEPARRHKCSLCKAVFECHLCDMYEDHDIHAANKSGNNTPTFYCENCINKNEMYVALTKQREPKMAHPKNVIKLGSNFKFYDHITGKLLGMGTIRRLPIVNV